MTSEQTLTVIINKNNLLSKAYWRLGMSIWYNCLFEKEGVGSKFGGGMAGGGRDDTDHYKWIQCVV